MAIKEGDKSMKKWKQGWLVLLLIMVFGFGGIRTEAAPSEEYNLIKTVSAKTTAAGKWVKNAKGYRYRYTASKKYAKNTWLKVKGKIYFVDKNGYRITGFKRYKKNRYYLDAKGTLVTGWKEIKGQSYYFSLKNGAMYTGWNKIGTKNYYFDEAGILKKNMWVEDTYVGIKGYEQSGKRIFVGDSRTVGLQKAVGSRDVYIAKWGKGYEWFMESGILELKKTLKQYPYSAVIFNLGVNDLWNVEQYILTYQYLKTSYPKARFYFLSVNPVEETFLRANGLNGRGTEEIENFNIRMKSVFNSFYIDSYHWMIQRNYVMDLPNGCGTLDGLHYIEAVYQMLYDYVISNVN